MLARLLYRLTASRPMRLIEVNGQPYLERYHIAKVLGRSIWLHHFIRDDEERHVHDHPWSALSVILTGEYVEEEQIDVETETGIPACFHLYKKRKALGINWIPASKKHRISSSKPQTWSLMLVGRRHGNGWFFYEGGEKYQPNAGTSEDWWKTAGRRDHVYVDRSVEIVRRKIMDSINETVR